MYGFWIFGMILRFFGWLIRGFFRLIGGIFRLIFGIFRRDARRRSTNRWLDNVDSGNADRKGVFEYADSPIEAFIANTGAENIVVSGTNQDLRNRVNCAVAWHCHNSGRGAIILHCSNSALVQLINNTFSGAPGLYSIQSTNPIYNPFLDLDRNDLSQLILSSSASDYRIERNGTSYISGLTEYLQLMGRPLCVDSYANCLRERDYEQLMEMTETGRVSDFVARRIQSQLAQGQMELGNVEQYFNVLRQQGRGVLASEASAAYGISIKKALQQNQVIVLDIGNASNSLLLSIAVQEIRDALAMGLTFSLVVDSIPLDASELLDRLIRGFSGQCSYVYSSQDVYADVQSTSNVFDTLVGRANLVFVLQHYSAVTCQKFSEFFGEYQRTEVDRTRTDGDNYQTFGQVLPGSSYNNVYHQQDVTRRRVEPQEISAQSPDHAYVRRAASNEIVSVRCTSGNVRGLLLPPRRLARAAGGSSRRRINWLIFALLFLLIPPTAFIYSFIVCGRRGKIISAILFVLSIVAIILMRVPINV